MERELTQAEHDACESAHRLGGECADSAYDAGGGPSGPWEETGVPDEPQRGDWELFARRFPHATELERTAFALGYSEQFAVLMGVGSA